MFPCFLPLSIQNMPGDTRCFALFLNQMLGGMNGHILAAASLCGVYFAD